MAQGEKNLTYYPTLSMNQAAAIFMWSPRIFRDKFVRVLQSEIRHVKTQRGMRLLLEDVLRASYPDAPDGTIYELAFDYSMRDAMRRKETWGKRSQR
jgi:hypothetical protein